MKLPGVQRSITPSWNHEPKMLVEASRDVQDSSKTIVDLVERGDASRIDRATAKGQWKRTDALAAVAQAEFRVTEIQLSQAQRKVAKLEAQKETDPGLTAIGAARDEVELLRAKLDVDKARVNEAQVDVEANKELFELAKGIASGSRIEMANIRGSLKRSEAQLSVRQAELKVAEVLLHQAQRRLARLEGQKEKEPSPAAIDEVRDEVEVLSQSLRVCKAHLAESAVDNEQDKELLAIFLKMADFRGREKAQAEVNIKKSAALLDVRQAEVKVAETRLKHAQQRLIDLEKSRQ